MHVGVALIALPLFAQEIAVPDFSKGMPDVNLEKKDTISGRETFHLKITLTLEGFSTALSKFLGAGWSYRNLKREEMI